MPTVSHHEYRFRVWRTADGLWNWEVTDHWIINHVFVIDAYPVKSGLCPWRWQARMAGRTWRNRLTATRGAS